jgi:Flp pilus assembly protein TadD
MRESRGWHVVEFGFPWRAQRCSDIPPCRDSPAGRAMNATTIFARNQAAARAAVRRISFRLRRHDDAEAWHALGIELKSLGERVGAIVAFRNALRLDAGRIHSRLALGNLLFDAGLCERALRCFDIAGDA